MFLRCRPLLVRMTFYYRQLAAEPHFDRRDTGGEDAFLSLDNVQAVLDGVGWWRHNTDVSAGLLSAAFARGMYDWLQEECLGEPPRSSYDLLKAGYEESLMTGIQGTTTALVATLQQYKPEVHGALGYRVVDYDAMPKNSDGSDNDGEDPLEDSPKFYQTGKDDPAAARAGGARPPPPAAPPDPLKVAGKWFLDVANVGDCTMLLIRRGQVLFVSDEQQHDIDYPYQLGSSSADTAESSDRFLLPVQRGDIVVMGTDGIFDNIYTHHLAELLWAPVLRVYHAFNYLGKPGGDGGDGGDGGGLVPAEINGSRRDAFAAELMTAIQEAKAVIMRTAIEVSRDKHCDSPYASKAIARGALYEGGKPDDMTLLISVIAPDADADTGDRLPADIVGFPPPYRDWP